MVTLLGEILKDTGIPLNRLERALKGREVRSIHLSGGVSCNSELRHRSRERFAPREIPVYYPRPALTTDNAATDEESTCFFSRVSLHPAGSA